MDSRTQQDLQLEIVHLSIENALKNLPVTFDENDPWKVKCGGVTQDFGWLPGISLNDLKMEKLNHLPPLSQKEKRNQTPDERIKRQLMESVINHELERRNRLEKIKQRNIEYSLHSGERKG